jgi:hypothetical protein
MSWLPVGKNTSSTSASAVPPGESSVCVVKNWSLAAKRTSPAPAPRVRRIQVEVGDGGDGVAALHDDDRHVDAQLEPAGDAHARQQVHAGLAIDDRVDAASVRAAHHQRLRLVVTQQAQLERRVGQHVGRPDARGVAALRDAGVEELRVEALLGQRLPRAEHQHREGEREQRRCAQEPAAGFVSPLHERLVLRRATKTPSNNSPSSGSGASRPGVAAQV